MHPNEADGIMSDQADGQTMIIDATEFATALTLIATAWRALSQGEQDERKLVEIPINDADFYSLSIGNTARLIDHLRARIDPTAPPLAPPRAEVLHG